MTAPLPPFAHAVADAARRALLRVVLGEMRRMEELELEPAARWELLRRALERFGKTRMEER